MRRRTLLVALTVLALSGAPERALAGCRIGELAELPVTMNAMRPLVTARINGTEAQFIADSGAFFSMITPSAAEEFKLRPEVSPGFFISGVGGDTRAWLTTVRTFTLFGVAFRNVPFVVGGNGLEGAAGLLGQNVFRILDADVEYDLAHGAIRLFRTHDCRKTILAYWTREQPLPVSVVRIEWATRESPHTRSVALVNGARIRVMFDTGAWASVLSLAAAERAGVKPGGAGVVAAGQSHGVGQRMAQSWIAPFASFKIGDEEILNTHLRIGDIGSRDTDMLIGTDFFLSHRIYVAISQGKLYFTYNGGPVFNLTSQPLAALAGGKAQPGSAEPPPPEDEPKDAAGFSRRGAAFTARRDYEHAIADLTRACELTPTEPEYFYQRGIAHWANSQPDLAGADFDRALELKADDVPALIARARLRLQVGERAPALADLDAADRAAPEQSDLRLQMAHLYTRAGGFEHAVTQLDKWIGAHGSDVQIPEARHARCWARALAGSDLDKALADCNAALKARPGNAPILDSRGVVRLRLGDLDRAIADFDSALTLDPRRSWALYGRGLARSRKGESDAADADIAAAVAITPDIEDRAREYRLAR